MCVFALKGEFEGEGDGVGGCEGEGGGWLEVFDGGLLGKGNRKRLVLVGECEFVASVNASRDSDVPRGIVMPTLTRMVLSEGPRCC